MSGAPAASEIRIGDRLFAVRDLTPADADSLLRLHQRVFGDGATPGWYDWKYAAGGGSGSGVWHQDELIAHCGGVPRPLQRGGRRVGGIQIGDVMVAPEWRGLLTRRGPFFQVSDRYYSTHVGAGTGHDIAFGFPSARHIRLAVTLKLLWDGGPIDALTWRVPQEPAWTPGWRWRWEPIEPTQPGFDAIVRRAWQRMRERLADHVVGEREPAYVRWRFFERPDRTARLFALRRPWSAAPAGLAVMELGAPQAQWLDWIGDPGAMPVASRACIAEAARHGANSLVAWCSPAVTECLRDTGIEHRSETARLGIPRASALDEAELASLRWWFMGGDTDFL